MQTKSSKGITLIALVVTIVILLILAGVTINLMFSENGLIKKAQEAGNSWNEGIQKDQNSINNLTDQLNMMTGLNVSYSKLKVGDYVNYPVYYDNVTDAYSNKPEDKYKGWRILSIEGTGENQYVKLISAGIPLNYYHKDSSVISTENLTTKFLTTEISSTETVHTFNQCGFKIENNSETYLASIADVKNLFTNEYTAIYKEGESASYTDSVLNTTFTNTEVVGFPKVQSITKADVDKVFGKITEAGDDLTSNELLVFNSRNGPDSHVAIFTCSARDESELWVIYESGGFIDSKGDDICGIRPVVTLKNNIKFKPAQNKINDTTTWDISL